jgi:hypothetical protein
LIRRRKKTDNFTVLPNIVLTDERISIAARWCLAYLLSKPDDWVVQITDIQKVAGVGRDKAYSMVRELIEAGWIRRDEHRDEAGSYRKHEYVVSEWAENPANDPLPEKPDTAKPDTVQPDAANTHLTKNGLVPRTESTKNSYDEGFERFWKAYPKRDGGNPKPEAYKAWKKAVKREDAETVIAAVKAYAKDCEKRGKVNTEFIPMAATWLNKERWNDIATGGAHALTDERKAELARILGL